MPSSLGMENSEKTMKPLSSEYTDDNLLALIHWHTIDIVVGLAGTLLCIFTLFVFVSSKNFFCANKLLTILAVGDLSTCLGITTMGFSRKNTYMAAMEMGRVPIESTWSCAIKSFVWLRLLGSVIAPGIVFWISVERFLAVFTPMIYRNHVAKYTGISPLVIVIYTIIATVIAYVIAFVTQNSRQAPFYCGRKVSFTVYYVSYVYCADVAGFIIALILNILTLCKLGNLYTKKKNLFEVRRQLKRIRYMIVISWVSTLFVALPNGISLVSAWIGRIDMYFMEPAVWMTAFKSSINIFVYLLLKTEFRQRVYELLGCLSIDDRKRERVFDMSMFCSSMVTPHQRAAADAILVIQQPIRDGAVAATAAGEATEEWRRGTIDQRDDVNRTRNCASKSDRERHKSKVDDRHSISNNNKDVNSNSNGMPQGKFLSPNVYF